MQRTLFAAVAATPLLLAACAGGNPAKSAMDRGDMALLGSVLDSGFDVNQKVGIWPFNLLEYAACHGYDSAVKLLLDYGMDVNKGREHNNQFSTGWTPLSRAIGCNAGGAHPSTVRLLLDRGAKVDPMSLYMVGQKYNDGSVVQMVREAYELQKAGKSAAKPAVAAARPDAAPSATSAVSSDVDAPKSRGAQRPDDFALVIGVEEYQSLPKADYGVRDAKTVRKHLEAIGFPARNIVSLEGQAATGSALKSYLEEWLPLNVKPASTLFVYYSGHGAPDPANGEAYLVPWDGNPSFLKSSAYPLKKLYSDLSKTKAKRVLVALDACFSGAGGRSVLAKGARPLVAKTADLSAGGKVTVLAAASGEQITGSLDEQGHGMFTYFLLKGMAEGKRSAKELHDYLAPRVEDEARRQNRQQTPALIGADAPL